MRAGRLMAVVAAVVLGVLGLSPAARAALSWSSPISLDQRGSLALNDVACPESVQCTSVDASGREVTFDPGDPGAATGFVIDPGNSLSAIACPSTSQCTAVASADLNSASESTTQVVTFDPRSPANATSAQIYTSGFLDDVSCPSMSQCTVVTTQLGCGSDELTFDPADPAEYSEDTIDEALYGCPVGHFNNFGPRLAVDCPSMSECVTVDSQGQEITFDPAAPGKPQPAMIDPGNYLTAVACLSSLKCVAVDMSGLEIAFDPSSPGGASPVAVDAHPLDDVACVSVSSCTAVDNAGAAVTFDPASPGVPQPETIDAGNPLAAVTCPSASECVAVDSAGTEVAFEPGPPASPRAGTIDRGTRIDAVACATPSQCTALDDPGYGLTFDPKAPGPPRVAQVAVHTGGPANNETSGACPSARVCVALEQVEPQTVLVFDPVAGTGISRTPIDTSHSLFGLACASATRCVAVDSGGEAWTFNPSARNPHPAGSIVDGAGGLTAVSCPSASQCTAVDAHNAEVTFNPSSPKHARRAVIDPDADSFAMIAVACPSVSQCTALDYEGGEVTFDPAAPARARRVAIAGSQTLFYGLACPAVGFCATVDGSGDVLEGDPGSDSGWSAEPVAGAGSLLGISCTSASECVVVDSVGDAFVGTQAVPPPGLGAVRESHRVWRERGRHGAGSAPTGTRFAFTLREPSQVVLTFTEHRAVAGTLTYGGHTGTNRVPFGGRLSRTRRLAPGRYRVAITATTLLGRRSTKRMLTFTIVG